MRFTFGHSGMGIAMEKGFGYILYSGAGAESEGRVFTALSFLTAYKMEASLETIIRCIMISDGKKFCNKFKKIKGEKFYGC